MVKLSIIIPVYNRAEVVSRTLETVLAQTFRPLQLVLVDNCSSDNTLQVLQRFRQENASSDLDIKVVQESVHTAGAARNCGAREADGEWLMFFDSDDEMDASLVGEYVREIENADGNLDIVSTKALLKMADGTEKLLPFHTSDIMAVQLLHSQLATQRYIVRREFFDQCDGWNINLPVWNDWELGVRMLLANPRIAFMADQVRVTVNHSGKDSITGSDFSSKEGQWEHTIDIVETEIIASDIADKHRYLRLVEYKRIALAAAYEAEGNHDTSVKLCRKAYGRLRDSYGNSSYWRWVVAPIVRRLFARIVSGKRGSAQIARRIL